MKKSNAVDMFIAEFPKETQIILQKVRETISKAAPAAEESINYGIPTFKLEGNLVHFSGYKHHIGFYPGATGIKVFEKELSIYKGAKGSVQFPLDKPIPYALISKITKFRVKQNIEKAASAGSVTKAKSNSKKTVEPKNLKTCLKGHKFVKSSNCPTCPICEQARKPKNGFLSLLSAPARRALENNKIKTLKKLSTYSEDDIIKLHGMGKSSTPILIAALKAEKLSFKKTDTKRNKILKAEPKAKTVKLSDSEQVIAHIKKLEPSIGKVVETIRQIILSADKNIGERIKWNNPSFYYTGPMKESDPKEYKREIAVFNLHKGRIMLVFPSGAKVNDTSGLLEGDYKDGRRLAVFKDLKDIQSKEKALKDVVKKWLTLVDK